MFGKHLRLGQGEANVVGNLFAELFHLHALAQPSRARRKHVAPMEGVAQRLQEVMFGGDVPHRDPLLLVHHQGEHAVIGSDEVVPRGGHQQWLSAPIPRPDRPPPGELYPPENIGTPAQSSAPRPARRTSSPRCTDPPPGPRDSRQESLRAWCRQMIRAAEVRVSVTMFVAAKSASPASPRSRATVRWHDSVTNEPSPLRRVPWQYRRRRCTPPARRNPLSLLPWLLLLPLTLQP